MNAPTDFSSEASPLDVSEINPTVLGLLEIEQRFAYVQEATRDGIWDWNIETGQLYLSPQWFRLLEYTPTELEHHVDTFFSLLHPADLPEVQLRLQRHLSGLTEEKQSEIRLRTKSGKYRWFLDRGKVVTRDASGNPTRMVGTITDIEERKQTERRRADLEMRLLERERRLRKAQSISRIGNFHWDATTDVVEWSDELFRIYGRDAKTFIPSFTSYVDAIHPEDRVKVMYSLQRSIEAFEEFDHDYRVIRPDGALIWVHAIGGAITNELGVLVGLEGTCQDITGRRKADEAELEARQRLQKIASRVPGVVYEFRLRPDGSHCFPYASSAIREMFGVDAESLCDDGRAVLSTFHPDDISQIVSSIHESADRLAPWNLEFRIRLDAGAEKWIGGSSVPVRDPDGGTRWHGVLMDITERKKVEEALRWNQSLLQMMSDSSPLAFMVVDDRTDAILYINQRCCEIWGVEHIAHRIRSGELSNRELIPYCLPMLTDSQEFAASCAALQDESNRRIVEDEIAFVDGRTIRRFSTQIRDEADRYHGRFYMFEDITARKQAETERESLHAQLRESQKMEAVGTLAGGIAHDFNNILAVILGNTEIAVTVAKEDSTLKLCLEAISKASIRARDLVLQILSFSRQQPTELKPICIASVVQESASLLKATLPARINLVVECQADLPIVLGNATQLEQVIINLATNSMQAIGSDEGNIAIQLKLVELDSHLAETNATLRAMYSGTPHSVLCLTVSDDGPGMNSAELDRIFEPFFTTKPIGKGTGLGLAVVHGIIETHRGAITVESSEKQGTRFAIYLLPTATESLAPANSIAIAEAEEVAKGQQSDTQLSHILLLDDNAAVLNATQMLLETRGYHVTSFTNQEEALAAVLNDPSAFDLIVTDYNMQGMSGLEVASSLKRICPGMPVALTSGFIDEELQHNAMRVGVKELIGKPFSSPELFTKVEQLLALACNAVGRKRT